MSNYLLDKFSQIIIFHLFSLKLLKVVGCCFFLNNLFYLYTHWPCYEDIKACTWVINSIWKRQCPIVVAEFSTYWVEKLASKDPINSLALPIDLIGHYV